MLWSLKTIEEKNLENCKWLTLVYCSLIFNPWVHSPLVSYALSFAFYHVLVFSGLLLCPWVIGFLSCFFFTIEVSAPYAWPALPHCSWGPVLGLVLVSTNLCVGVTWSRNLDPNFYPGRVLNLGPLTFQSGMQLLDHCAPTSRPTVLYIIVCCCALYLMAMSSSFLWSSFVPYCMVLYCKC